MTREEIEAALEEKHLLWYDEAKCLLSECERLEAVVKTHEDFEVRLVEAKHQNWLDWKKAGKRVEELEQQIAYEQERNRLNVAQADERIKELEEGILEHKVKILEADILGESTSVADLKLYKLVKEKP
jgi:hypothetical protein